MRLEKLQIHLNTSQDYHENIGESHIHQRMLCRFSQSSHLEIDVSRVFGQYSHHVGEALIYGDVQRRAQRVVQEVHVSAFAQQQPCDLGLITVGTDTSKTKI